MGFLADVVKDARRAPMAVVRGGDFVAPLESQGAEDASAEAYAAPVSAPPSRHRTADPVFRPQPRSFAAAVAPPGVAVSAPVAPAMTASSVHAVPLQTVPADPVRDTADLPSERRALPEENHVPPEDLIRQGLGDRVAFVVAEIADPGRSLDAQAGAVGRIAPRSAPVVAELSPDAIFGADAMPPRGQAQRIPPVAPQAGVVKTAAMPHVPSATATPQAAPVHSQSDRPADSVPQHARVEASVPPQRPAPTALRPERPQPAPETPRVRIGRVDIVVLAPEPARPSEPNRTSASDLASRFYLRRL